MNIPKCSIITVVYNGESVLPLTLQSIICQTFKSYEYIVIDGASVDGTIDFIRNNQMHIGKWISEKDQGLYDAMNKGLALAQGEYVWFLNAGDRIFDEQTLERTFAEAPPDADIIYGDTMIADDQGKDIGPRRLKPPENLSWKSLRDGMVVCHQSVIVKRSLAETYDIRYKVAGDYEWLIRVLKKAKTAYYTGFYVCRFLEGGINKKRIIKALAERFEVMVRHFGLLPTLLRHFVIGWRFITYVVKNRRF
ncbi:MAG TPA: glycosyltransferase family 2 protein [Bacteroidales bacterium]|mgnify:CR=1 FL=1|nr:glycosyltransferase family 2 protein [Bacteroidales bacterium]